MASSSCSLIESFKYDVFLSFRGEDTRKNFVGHLYEALEAKCIETYKDDEKIEKGERINNQLLKSIEDSRFYIIVFSKNYASSSWCLDELVKIIECQKMTEHTAFPVFYDVEPTEVRKQYGPVGEAFSKHENQEAAGKWRDAMKELADLAGWELKATANGDESKLIQTIVDAIFKKLHSTNSSADGKLVGMETRISDILSSLEIGTEDVRMIGIKGMGGAGKTTLAGAVYDRISNHFEGKNFVENVREVSQPSLCGLKKLQKRILEDVLKKDITVSSVHDGKNMLKATMRRRKILVVLDDVNCIEQLEALAGEPNWFKSGSRVIITTRDEQVLKAHGVKFVHDVNLLSSTEAICLFSRYAFKKEIPIQGYEELSWQVVQYAAGLPLTIKVMGSFLCGQNEPYWVDAIERLKPIPLKATLERLEISFNGLEDDYKEIFLDVACILKGRNKEDAIRVLESRGFHAEVGLRVLEQRSLITYNEDGKLWMHDHLEEMGRNIVRRSHPDEPQRHSRLWIKEEIEYILSNDQGTQETKCLFFQSLDFSAEIAIKGLAKMKDLRFLDIEVSDECINWKFDKVRQYLPNSLQFVHWIDFPFSSLPNTFQGKHLVGLEMSLSKIVQLWEDGEEKVLSKLRFLTIRFSKLRTFDLRVAPNLEQLTICYCSDFVELHMPAQYLKIKYLNLSDSKLTTLNLGVFPNVETLLLTMCTDLVELQMPVENLKLRYLDLTHSKLKTIHLGKTPNLETLILEGCNDLVELQMPVVSLKLKELNLSHSKLRILDLGLTPNLKMLDLENCYGLVDINAPVGCLRNISTLDLSGCGSFKSFLFHKQLDSDDEVGSSSNSHEIGSLSELHLIAEPTNVCPLHPDNKFPKLKFSCLYKEDPASSSFGNLETLISVGLCACTNLETFSKSICSLQCIRKLTLEGGITEAPKDLYQLEYLEELTFSFTEIKYLPDNICKLKHLISLKIKSCWLLEKLPDDIGRLKSLETLILTDCKLLQDIPNSICKMKCINSFDLRGCIRVVELPKEIGSLEGLKELIIEGTGITRLPQSIFKLRGLRIVDTYGLLLKRRRTSDDDEIVCYI